MKKIYIILAIFITATSCKESIELAPEDSYATANFFKTEAQFKQAIAGAYVPLRDVIINDFHMAEMRSDNTHYQPIPNNRGAAYVNRENIDDFENLPGNTYTLALWESCYKVISRANVIIERIPASEIPATVKDNVDGQAKFLRAWSYFKLVRHFGGVPLYLKELKKAEDAFVNRSTEAEVYNQIIADAKDAITKLSNPVFTNNKQTGEATKGAATILLADVYVTQKKWAEAEALLITIEPMGYQLQPNYADAFSPAFKNSRESIFEVQYLEGTVAGTAPNTVPFMFLPRTPSTAVITGATFPSNNKTDGGWNTPTPDLISAYEAGDKRLDASIGIIEGAYNGSDEFIYSVKKDYTTATPPAAGKINLPYVKKFIHPPYIAALNSNTNWPIYRFSEALLLLAEAQNEQNKTTALQSLNKVRTRAFGTGLGQIVTTDQTALRAIILKERRTELAFENKRWHDLVRMGNAVQIMNAHGTAIKAQFPWHPASSYNVTANKLLFPIPSSEIGFNPALTQNPL